MAKQKKQEKLSKSLGVKKSRVPPTPKTKEYIKAAGGRRLTDLFDPAELNWMDLSDVKKIYSELRSVAVKRLKRQSESEYNKSRSYLFYSGKNMLRTIKQIEEDSKQWGEKFAEENFRGSLYGSIIDAQKYLIGGGILKEKESTAKLLETLHEKGGAYEWINDDNVKDFGNFMEYLREKYDLKRNSLASDRAAQLWAVYSQTNKEDEIKEKFLAWQENEKELESLMNKIGAAKKLSASKLKQIVTSQEKKVQKKAKYSKKKRNRNKRR